MGLHLIRNRISRLKSMIIIDFVVNFFAVNLNLFIFFFFKFHDYVWHNVLVKFLAQLICFLLSRQAYRFWLFLTTINDEMCTLSKPNDQFRLAATDEFTKI